jgi:hypothetical protein
MKCALRHVTWSHCVASERDDFNGSLFGPTLDLHRVDDRECGRTNCTSIRRHVLNLTGVLESPRFANDKLRIFASGRRLAPIYRISTGQWLSVTAAAGLDSARNGTGVEGIAIQDFSIQESMGPGSQQGNTCLNRQRHHHGATSACSRRRKRSLKNEFHKLRPMLMRLSGTSRRIGLQWRQLTS